jgi:D-alanyl-D-alanine dipeptidase
MFLYERKNQNKDWKLIDSFKVVVGKNGLGKDRNANIPFADSAPIKHEGDGKSPAGIFPLGSVFSYHSLKHLHMPFVQVDTNFYCVDDVASSYYNTLIKQDTAKHNYNSFEYMKRNDSLYEYGVWVLYNSNPVIAGNGSCIFLHIWRNENSGTAGCTAMAKENILKLIHWLDKKKNPVLLQEVVDKVE